MKFSYMIVLLTIITLISGCNNNSKTPGTVDGTPFIGGTTGLVVTFAEDAPPKEIYDNGEFPFNIDVVLKNQGEYTVPAADTVIKIKSIYPGDYGKTSSDLVMSPNDDILGENKDITGRIIPGAEIHTEFIDLNYGGSIVGSMQTINVIADVCYGYQTIANSKICVREKMSTPTDGVCEVNEFKTVYNSGAPVGIENFQESGISQNKYRITFDIVHQSTGTVFEQDSDCTDEVRDKNKVHVTVNTGLNGDIRCSGLSGSSGTSGVVRLSDGRATLYCTQTILPSEKGDYEKTVSITLDYKYNIDITKSVILKHTGE